VAFVVEQVAAERPLGAFAAGNLVLLGRELTSPFRVGLDDLGDLDGADELTLVVEDFDSHWQLLYRVRTIAAAASERPGSWQRVSP
jgi:hypothetical protein